MCPGCGHRSAFHAIRTALAPEDITVADIGCHTLGYLPPYQMGQLLMCMGASTGMGSGLSLFNTTRRVVAVQDGRAIFSMSASFHLDEGGFEHQAPMPETTCVFCGNCVAVCPTNALKDKTEYFLEQGMDYDQIRLEKRKARRIQRDRQAAQGGTHD